MQACMALRPERGLSQREPPRPVERLEHLRVVRRIEPLSGGEPVRRLPPFARWTTCVRRVAPRPGADDDARLTSGPPGLKSFSLSLQAIPTMRRQLAGRIVNMSSVMGLIPAPYAALYASSKHAVEGYSESLDHEVRSLGVRVVLVEPAYTGTRFERNLIKADRPLDEYAQARSNVEDVIRDAMKTADSPELVAQVVLQASTAANPRRRYTAGRMAGQVSLLRRVVPENAFDKSLRKQMRLPA